MSHSFVEWMKIFSLIMFAGRKFREIEYPTVDGNWPGDDTVWRMVLDLYRMLIYLDKSGRFCEHPQRNHLSLIDGIIAGENFGPLGPTVKRAGVIIAGYNPVHTDYVATQVIGINKKFVRFIDHVSDLKCFPLVTSDPDHIRLYSNIESMNQHFSFPKQWSETLLK
jgi:hypothetical protein